LVAVDAELSELSATLAADLRMRGADVIYTALARRLGVPLITWDQEQRERSQPTVAVLTPAEALQP
jgi:predicted nucleic acid-binding protein